MPVFHQASPEARVRLIHRGKGYQERQVYRDNLVRLADGSTWEIEPEAGESLRKIKVNARRAANELNMPIRYGETAQGTLLVWQEATPERRTGVHPFPWTGGG
jgi:hypothetical protein